MNLLWWRYDRVSLVSPFSLEQCRVLLENSTDAERIFGRQDHEVVAQIGRDTFRIRKHQGLVFRNFSEPMVYGRMIGTRNGTQIGCRVGPQGLAIAVMLFMQIAIWGVFASWIVGGFLPLEPYALLNAAIGPVVMTLCITLGMNFGRWMARKKAAFLLDFLGMLLDAREAPSELPRHSLAAAERRARGE